MDSKNIEGAFNNQLLDSIFRTSKKTIQEYVWEIERNNRYKSTRLIDLYEASLQQDAHIRSVIETLESQILGDRYMLAKINEKGKYVKDVEETQKIQGSQFDKMIKGIVESKLYGYTLLEILPDINPLTGKEGGTKKTGYMAPQLGCHISCLQEQLCAYFIRGSRSVFRHHTSYSG